MARELTAGIIGGLGPLATVELMRRVIRLVPARDDQDHVRLLVDSNPKVPSRTAAVLDGGPSPAPALAAMARGLEAAGADFLAIPCNSAHLYLDAVRAAVDIPVVNMLELVGAEVGSRPVGLLATTSTIIAGLHERHLPGVRLVVPPPDEQADVMGTIMDVKRGRVTGRAVQAYVRALLDRGAGQVVLGCTELSVAMDDAELPTIDPLELLAQAIVDTARGRRELPALRGSLVGA